MMPWTHLHLCTPLPLLPLPLKITLPAFNMHHHSSTQIPLACIQYQATLSFILGEQSHGCCNSKALLPLPPHMPGVLPLLGPPRGSSCFTACCLSFVRMYSTQNLCILIIGHLTYLLKMQ